MLAAAVMVVCQFASLALAEPVRPQGVGRLHVLSVETNSVAGADVDASRIHAVAKDWVDITTPENAGFRSRWRQSKQEAGAAGIRGVILRKIDELRDHVRVDDVVLFFYSGHGATDQNGRHLLQFDDGGVLHRDDLFQRLRSLRCRLTLLVTDCCAVRIKLPPVPMSNVNPNEPKEEHRQLKQNLTALLQANGFYDVNSAATGQIAWGTRAGGIFTREFVEVLREKPVSDWDQFTRLVTEETESSYDVFRKSRLEDPSARTGFSPQEVALLEKQKTQRPLRFLHLTPAGMPPGEPPPPPIVPQPPALGAVVTRVTPGTSAVDLDLNGQQMTLEVGDRILAINGRPIQSAEHFGQVIDSLPRGAPITLIILSGRQEARMQLRGKLDLGGKFRLGVTVNDR